ncbi:MAG: GntR family transcriptional regulator [Firmicutes bacterium]|nr:GntR family transcriptional regulator [Bacillota bacterium]
MFLQIKERIEDQVVNGQLQEHEQIPSTTQMVHFYKVNHITISKGINLLVDEGIIYKKRGVGMFVAEGAMEKLIKNRKDSFADKFVLPMIQEARKLGLSDKDVNEIIKSLKESDIDES